MKVESWAGQETNSQRDDWEFEYTAAKIAEAAAQQRGFRLSRLEWWKKKKVEVVAQIKTDGIDIEQSIVDDLMDSTYSNSTRAMSSRDQGPRVVVDPKLQRQLAECAGKIREHTDAARAYDGWVQMLSANPESRLKLCHGDWLYFFGKGLPEHE